MKRTMMLTASLAAMVVCGLSAARAEEKVAVIVKATTSEYWQWVFKGAEDAGNLVVIQLETRETNDPPVELCRAGADVAFLGLTDLLVDCGLDEGAASRRADELAGAVAEAGVALGGFGAEERFRYAVVSSDVALLREAVANVG